MQVEFDAVNGNVLDCAANAEARFREAIDDMLWPDENYTLTSDAEDIDTPILAPKRKAKKKPGTGGGSK